MVDKVPASSYRDLFLQVCPCTDTDERYECIGRAIAAYERSAEAGRYSSKYDYRMKGRATSAGEEKQGLSLFNGKGKCAGCHEAPQFADYSYDNPGVPGNLLNPLYCFYPARAPFLF